VQGTDDFGIWSSSQSTSSASSTPKSKSWIGASITSAIYSAAGHPINLKSFGRTEKGTHII
jgi:hypothetical protein